MAIQNSTLTKIYITGVAVANSTNVSLSTSVAYIDVTNKDSSGNKEGLGGTFEWSMTGDFVVDFSDSKGPDDIYTAMIAKTAVAVKYMNSTSGEVYYQGNGIITNFTMAHGTEESPTGSFEISGTGALSQKTLT